MTKKATKYADILFPQKINSLTYGVPEEYTDIINKGMFVEAPLRGKKARGLITRIRSTIPSGLNPGRIMTITSLNSDFIYPSRLLDLLQWVAKYYMSSEGLALKSLLFSDILQPLQRHRKISMPEIVPYDEQTVPDPGIMDEIVQSIEKTKFRTYLFHSRSTAHELSLFINIIRSFRNVIILTPEYHDISILLPLLEAEAKDRYCILHGSMNKTAVHGSYRGILNRKYDIVVGTMQTVFVPMPDPSLIIVFREYSPFFKHEETPAYNARDVAVKRGSIEKIPVLLTSMVPSLESYFNYMKKKYILLHDPVPAKPPSVTVINAAGTKSLFTSPLKRKIHQTLSKSANALLILNRKGHSILKCNDCGSMDLCPECNVPLVFHSEKVLKCHYCGRSLKVPDRCTQCGGTFLRFATSGTEKIYEELIIEFGDIVEIIDREHTPFEISPSKRILIGTELVFRGLSQSVRFGLTAILNADIHLQRPDFRAYEKFYQQVIYLSDLCEENGELVVQTYDWKNSYFETVKQLDYSLLFSQEIRKRHLFHYPPYYRIATLTIEEKDYIHSDPVKNNNEYEILGPMKRSGKSGKVELLIKCRTDLEIQKYIKEIRSRIVKKDRILKIDIDPLVFT